jgi:hypothetical protein
VRGVVSAKPPLVREAVARRPATRPTGRSAVLPAVAGISALVLAIVNTCFLSV